MRLLWLRLGFRGVGRGGLENRIDAGGRLRGTVGHPVGSLSRPLVDGGLGLGRRLLDPGSAQVFEVLDPPLLRNAVVLEPLGTPLILLAVAMGVYGVIVGAFGLAVALAEVLEAVEEARALGRFVLDGTGRGALLAEFREGLGEGRCRAALPAVFVADEDLCAVVAAAAAADFAAASADVVVRLAPLGQALHRVLEFVVVPLVVGGVDLDLGPVEGCEVDGGGLVEVGGLVEGDGVVEGEVVVERRHPCCYPQQQGWYRRRQLHYVVKREWSEDRQQLKRELKRR